MLSSLAVLEWLAWYSVSAHSEQVGPQTVPARAREREGGSAEAVVAASWLSEP